MGNESMLSPSKGICCICCQGGGVGPQLPLHVPVTGPCISTLHPALGNLHDLRNGGKKSQNNLKYNILLRKKKKIWKGSREVFDILFSPDKAVKNHHPFFLPLVLQRQ